MRSRVMVAGFLAFAMAAPIVAPASADVEVVPIPSPPTGLQHVGGTLSSDGGIAALVTNGSPIRVYRWTESTGALLQLAWTDASRTPYVVKVTQAGTVAGGWFQPSPPSLRGGVLWNASGTQALSPIGGSGAFGEAVASASSGSPRFIAETSQFNMWQWTPPSTITLRGRPLGTSSILPRDASADGSACVVACATPAGSRVYRWILGTGYELLPLPSGDTSATPIAISEDGTRVIGASAGPAGQRGFFWSAATGVVAIGFPAGASVTFSSASGDCTLVCGRYSIGAAVTPFVWSLHQGVTSAASFAGARGYEPSDPIEFLDFNASGTVALAKVGTQAVLLRNLGRGSCGAPGSCFATRPSGGCADAACCERVCTFDPTCCDVAWDAECVEGAEALCRTGLTCVDARRISPAFGGGATIDLAEDVTTSDESSCGAGDGRAAWRVYRAPGAGAVTVGFCASGPGGPIVLSVFSACGTEIGCGEVGSASCGTAGASLAFASESGSDYLIRVSSTGEPMAGQLLVSSEASCGTTEASCWGAHRGTGCGEATCCGRVCMADPTCCAVAWDEGCAELASEWCERRGDLDGDGDVDAGDLASLLAGWGKGGSADLDGSGSVDALDLAILLANWT